MQKYLLLLVTVLLTGQLQAQKEFWFELGAKGGVGLSFLTNKNILDDDNFEYQLTPMYNFGGKFAVNFGPVHSIMVEGMFNNFAQGFKYSLDGGPKDLDEKIKLKSFDLGILYRSNINRNYIELGPYLSTILSVEQTANADAKTFYEDDKLLHGVLGFGGYLTGAETFSVGMGLRFGYTFGDLVNPKGHAAGYPNPLRATPYDSVAASHFAWAQLMFELNFGVGHYAKTSCSHRFKRMRR